MARHLLPPKDRAHGHVVLTMYLDNREVWWVSSPPRSFTDWCAVQWLRFRAWRNYNGQGVKECR